MESLVYHLHRSELTDALFDKIRLAVNTSIDAEHIRISIAAEEAFEQSDAEFTPENRISAAFEAKILASMNDPVSFVFEGDEFEIFSQKLLNGENVDVEQYKRIRQ